MAFDIQLRDNGAGTFDIALSSGGGPVFFGVLKRWDGAAWVRAQMMTYNGATWTAASLKRWDGAAWVQVDALG